MKALTVICFVTYVLFTTVETVLTIRDVEMTQEAHHRLMNRKLGRSPSIAFNGNKE